MYVDLARQGDVLITSCTYNTEDRKLATVVSRPTSPWGRGLPPWTLCTFMSLMPHPECRSGRAGVPRPPHPFSKPVVGVAAEHGAPLSTARSVNE